MGVGASELSGSVSMAVDLGCTTRESRRIESKIVP